MSISNKLSIAITSNTDRVSESRGPQWSPILENSEHQKKKRGPRSPQQEFLKKKYLESSTNTSHKVSGPQTVDRMGSLTSD